MNLQIHHNYQLLHQYLIEYHFNLLNEKEMETDENGDIIVSYEEFLSFYNNILALFGLEEGIFGTCARFHRFSDI